MLPIFQTDLKDLSLMQTRWASELNPLLRNALVGGVFVKLQPLLAGANVINHRLGRKPQGWLISDLSAGITLFRSQPFNALTLTLTASGPATVDLYVF